MEALLSALILVLFGNPGSSRSVAAQTPARLNVTVAATVEAGQQVEVKVDALTTEGAADATFNGQVQVSLDAVSTPKIGCFLTPTACPTSLTLPMVAGKLQAPLFLRTPENELKADTVIRPGDPILAGSAVIKAQSGAITAPLAEVQVRSPLDLRIDRIEVQQGVRQSASDLWISEREMLVRVFLSANRESFDRYSRIEGIRARMIVRNRNGQEIPGSPFLITKGAIDASNNPASDFVLLPNPAPPNPAPPNPAPPNPAPPNPAPPNPAPPNPAPPNPAPPNPAPPNPAPNDHGAESLNYIIDGSTELQLSLEVRLDETIADLNSNNNTGTFGPMFFGISRGMTVQFARLRVETEADDPLSAGIKTAFPSETGIAREIEFLKQAYPITARSLRIVRQPDEVRSQTVLRGDPLNPLNDFLFGSEKGVRFVYFVDDDYFANIGAEAGVRGLTRNNLRFSIINSNRCAARIEDCGALAHELGHALLLGDTYVEKDKAGKLLGSSSDRNPRGPASPARGNLVEPGSYSWFHHRFTSASPSFLDFMGNGSPMWSDVATWNHLKSELLFDPFGSLSSREREGAGVEGHANLAKRVAHGLFVLAQGSLKSDGTGTFRKSYTQFLVDDGIPPTTGTHTIETLDAASSVIDTVNFTPDFKLSHTSISPAEFDFSFVLPFTGALRRIRLRQGATILATRNVTANVPSVNFVVEPGTGPLAGTQQVSWAGSDADGDPLTYSLYYSADGIIHIALTPETPATSYVWNVDDFPSGPLPRLTVVATDGVNSTLIESRALNIPNRAPRITITSPANQLQYRRGEQITFTGSFFDPEDDLNLKPALQWSSSLQGFVGMGKSISVANLSVGTHVISASGSDSKGASGSATVTVIVRADDFAALVASRNTLDFGTIEVGQAIDLTLRVQNIGNAPLTISGITTNNPRFTLNSPVLPVVFAAREENELSVRFTPIDDNLQIGLLRIEGANGSAVEVALTGKGVGAAAGVIANVSAASFTGSEQARDAIVAAFGASLAVGTEQAATVPLPLELAGTSVTVRDSTGLERFAPLFFVSPTQVNYLVPSDVGMGPATVVIRTGDGSVSLGKVSIAVVAPGVFTANSDGKGVPAGFAIRVKGDSSQMSVPVLRFDVGEGRFVPAPIDFGAPDDRIVLVLFGTGLRHRSLLAAVSCMIGGVLAPVEYAGEQGTFVGLDQVNINVPRSLAGRGEVDLVLTVEGRSSTVRVAFAPVAIQ